MNYFLFDMQVTTVTLRTYCHCTYLLTVITIVCTYTYIRTYIDFSGFALVIFVLAQHTLLCSEQHNTSIIAHNMTSNTSDAVELVRSFIFNFYCSILVIVMN